VGLRCGSSRSPTGTLVKALARAWRWQRMLDEGVYTTVCEIGDAEDIFEELQKPDPPPGVVVARHH
jgi:hypothetical protein